MKDIIKQMNKAFDSRVRIAIMAILLHESWVDFIEMKERLGLTDGNLASHIAALEKKQYIEVKKQFISKRPNTSYKMTERGKESFRAYIQALKQLLSNHVEKNMQSPTPQ